MVKPCRVIHCSDVLPARMWPVGAHRVHESCGAPSDGTGPTGRAR
jgi:hypothetical protein